MKLGTIGVNVKIIPPNAELPDDFRVQEGADIEDLIADDAGDESLEDLLEEPEEPTDEAPEGMPTEPDGESAVDSEEVEDLVGEAPEEEVPDYDDDVEVPGGEEAIEDELEELEADVDATESAQEQAAQMVEEMDDEEGDDG